MHASNWFDRILRNPKSKPHKLNLHWPMTIAADALLEFQRKGSPKPPDVPDLRLYILNDSELEFLAQAVDTIMVP